MISRNELFITQTPQKCPQITDYLSQLKAINEEKQSFEKRKVQRQMKKRDKKIQRSYQDYLQSHSRKSQRLVCSYLLYKKLDIFFIKRKREIFGGILFQTSTDKQYGKNNKNYQNLMKNQNAYMKQKISYLSLVLNKKIDENNKINMNFAFCNLKLNKKQANGLQRVRIIECKKVQSKSQIIVGQNSFQNNMLDVSIFQSKRDLCEKVSANYSKDIKTNLYQKFSQLQQQFQNLKKQYEGISNELTHKINKFQRDNKLKSTSVLHITDQLGIPNDLLENSEENVEENRQVKQFAAINQQLQQETDRVRETVQDLLRISQEEKNINPDIEIILKTVHNILIPSLLGQSFAS